MEKAKDLYKQLERAVVPDERIKLLFALAYEFMNTDLKRYEELMEEGHQLSIANNNEPGLAEYFNCLGRLHFKRSMFDESITAFEKCHELAIKLADKNMEANINESIGMVHWTLGNLDKAEEMSKKALEIYSSLQDPKGTMAMCLNSLGNVSERRGELDKAYDYYMQALERLKVKKHAKMQAIVTANLAVILSRKGLMKESIAAYLECLEVFQLSNNRNGEALTLTNIAASYYILEEYAHAMEYYLKALRMFKDIDNKKVEAQTLAGLGDVYTRFGGFDNALRYIQKSLELTKEIKYPNGQCTALASLADMYLEMGNATEAMKHLQECKTIIEQTGITSEMKRLKPLLKKAYTALGLPEIAIEHYFPG